MNYLWRRGFPRSFVSLLFLGPPFLFAAVGLSLTRGRRWAEHREAMFAAWREWRLAHPIPSIQSEAPETFLLAPAAQAIPADPAGQIFLTAAVSTESELSTLPFIEQDIESPEDWSDIEVGLDRAADELQTLVSLVAGGMRGELRVASCELPVVHDQLPVVSGELPVASDERPVAGGELPVGRMRFEAAASASESEPQMSAVAAVPAGPAAQPMALVTAKQPAPTKRGFAAAAFQSRAPATNHLLTNHLLTSRKNGDDAGMSSAPPPPFIPAAPAAPAPPSASAPSILPSIPPALAPAKEAEFNRTGIDFHLPMPRPKVHGTVIDFHCHLLAARHAKGWFECAAHYGIDAFVTMCPLEEAMVLNRHYGDRLQFIAVGAWRDVPRNWFDDFLNRVEMFHNLGSRIVKFHMAPGTMVMRKYRLDSPELRPIFREIAARRMAVMTHMGDPDTWYHGKYADTAKYGTRDEHYRMWEAALAEHPKDLPWIGAHMGGNPEDLPRLQRLLDAHPNLYLDCSATRWMVREISARREAARDFFIRNADRILFGSDQVSGDDRGFDFLASRFWAHRKLWETAYIGPSPIHDPDVPEDRQPTLHGLALPDDVLQKLYHANAVKVMGMVGAGFEWG